MFGADRSRQVSGDSTEKSRPSVRTVLSVNTSCTCFSITDLEMVPRSAASGWAGLTTVTEDVEQRLGCSSSGNER